MGWLTWKKQRNVGVISTTDAKWEWGNELTFVHVDKHHI